MIQVIRRMVRLLGFDIVRYPMLNSDAGRLQRLLVHHGIDLVFDVGANVGQFALWLRRSGYRGRIVSFEPLSQAYAELERISALDPEWIVAPRSAIGAKDGEAEINVSENSESSSVLGMKGLHRDAAPESRYVGKERVSLRRLDSIATQYLTPGRRAFLKIDTQGFEGEVIAGATSVISQVRGMQVEVSLAELYEGQPDFVNLVADLRSQGFEIWSLAPGFADPRSGRLLQIDAVFFRPDDHETFRRTTGK